MCKPKSALIVSPFSFSFTFIKLTMDYRKKTIIVDSNNDTHEILSK